jgi:phosphoenolpyruvate carboxykinase (GTP)
MKLGEDGRLYAINPEKGFFGVAPGTSWRSNPNAMAAIGKNTIFTNVALTPDGDVWWEEMTQEVPQGLMSWKGQPWDANSMELSSHPNARFTVEASQCPIISSEMDNPQGVPISAIIFGGRRASLEPLIYEAFDFEHGVFLGAALTSEMTAAATGVMGQVRHDPFAMLPFCGYNMADYFGHWLSMTQKTSQDKLPKIFHVNWFRKDSQGRFLWPGFGENARVLKWIFQRVAGEVEAKPAPLGLFPYLKDFDQEGLALKTCHLDDLFIIDRELWQQEVLQMQEYFAQFGERLPEKLSKHLLQLQQRIGEIYADAAAKS